MHIYLKSMWNFFFAYYKFDVIDHSIKQSDDLSLKMIPNAFKSQMVPFTMNFNKKKM